MRALSVMLLVLASSFTPEAIAEEVSPFSRLELHGEVDVLIEPASVFEVVNLSPSNSFEQALVQVSDGVLFVAARPGVPIMLLVRVPELREVLVNGHSNVRSMGLRSAHLVLESNGSGTFEFSGLQLEELSLLGSGQTLFRISGQARRQVIDLVGAAQVEAPGLVTRSSEIKVRGSGEVVVHASEHLNVDVAGTAKVLYTGAPSIARQVSGIGIVQPIR